MSTDEHQVLVLDDCPAIRAGLERLLVSHGYRVRMHPDPDDFFAAGPPAGPACLLLDNHLEAKLTGLQVHAEIVRMAWNLPTIFLTAHWDVRSVVAAIRAGADDFVPKPYEPAALLRAVAEALERAEVAHRQGRPAREARALAAKLTKRELGVVRLVLTGKLNKEIADDLGLAEITVKVHRGRAMVKLGAGNPAELVRIAQAAGIRS